jgi:hypothetical protein
VAKVRSASASLCSSCSSVKGSKVFNNSPVTGFIDAIAMIFSPFLSSYIKLKLAIGKLELAISVCIKILILAIAKYTDNST